MLYCADERNPWHNVNPNRLSVLRQSGRRVSDAYAVEGAIRCLSWKRARE